MDARAYLVKSQFPFVTFFREKERERKRERDGKEWSLDEFYGECAVTFERVQCIYSGDKCLDSCVKEFLTFFPDITHTFCNFR